MNIDSSTYKMNHRFLFVLLILFIASCFMAGCEKEDQSTPPIPKMLKKYDKATVLEGSVSDDHGPVKAGVIKVTDNNEQLVASATLQGSNLYTVEIPANTILPIVLTFYPDAQNGDAEKLVTAVVHPEITKYDINPLTTAIANKAKSLGGYNHANMVRAAEATVKVPDANKTTEGFRGDPTTQYGGWH